MATAPKAQPEVEPIPNDDPPEPVEHPDIATALAAFQRNLPSVRKGQVARVTAKDGGASYTYDYADLTDISEVVLPLLAMQGLAWHTGLSTDNQGNIILKWRLIHSATGDRFKGWLPVGRSGAAWQGIGSSITYARRYALTAATGVAPGGDDDDAATAVTAGQAPPPRAARGSAQRPPAPTAPIVQQTGPLPPELYRLSSLDSLEATQDMYRKARAAGHLRLTIGIPDENGTVIETAFEDVLTQIGERFKSPAAEEAAEQAAIAAHEAETAQAPQADDDAPVGDR